jgi:patatin-like phospholipase/acyl hydrolase
MRISSLGSFRVTQKIALRATTAAPTFFKPLLSFDELYVDGGIVASNPTAVAVHEARTVYPGVPLELVVSVGTGGKYVADVFHCILLLSFIVYIPLPLLSFN